MTLTGDYQLGCPECEWVSDSSSSTFLIRCGLTLRMELS
jgi:hypothetical protein